MPCETRVRGSRRAGRPWSRRGYQTPPWLEARPPSQASSGQAGRADVASAGGSQREAIALGSEPSESRRITMWAFPKRGARSLPATPPRSTRRCRRRTSGRGRSRAPRSRAPRSSSGRLAHAERRAGTRNRSGAWMCCLRRGAQRRGRTADVRELAERLRRGDWPSIRTRRRGGSASRHRSRLFGSNRASRATFGGCLAAPRSSTHGRPDAIAPTRGAQSDPRVVGSNQISIS